MKCFNPLLLTLALLPCASLIHAQSSYNFANPTLVSGTALAVGATYRFSNVKTGTDALVKITNMTGGMTLGTPLDQTTTGYGSAFQPTLNVPALSNGYVEFNITFVATGTSTAQAQVNLEATALDIDGLIVGTDSLFEFDMLDMGTGSYLDYSVTGGQLTITKNGTQYTGQTHTGTNYPGIDTTAKAVMFSDISPSVSTLTYRTGVINNINEVPPSRVASLYFNPFSYPNSILPIAPLLSFTGDLSNHDVNLQWSLIPDSKVDTIWVERSTDGRTFRVIGTLDNEEAGLSFTDDSAATVFAAQGILFYRLQLHQKEGGMSQSYVVSMKISDGLAEICSIYPTIFHSNATLHISTQKEGPATFLLVDTRGQVVQRRDLSLAQGSQTIDIDGLDRLPPGLYFAFLKTGEATFRQKLVKMP